MIDREALEKEWQEAHERSVALGLLALTGQTLTFRFRPMTEPEWTSETTGYTHPAQDVVLLEVLAGEEVLTTAVGIGRDRHGDVEQRAWALFIAVKALTSGVLGKTGRPGKTYLP